MSSTPPQLLRADALVTNGQSRIGLNIARSLGRAGLRVVLGVPRPASPGSVSRYVSGHFVHPMASRFPEAFVETLAQEVDRWQPKLVIPADDASLAVLSRAADRFVGKTILACPPYPTVRQVLDKEATLALAARLDVPAPVTVRLDPERPLEPQLAALRYPVILKPRLKRLEGEHNEVKVLYCADRGDLLRQLSARGREQQWVLQEYVPGTDVGLVTLAQRGRPLVWFQQRSLRDLPPGGLSVLRVAEPPDPRLQEYSARILGALGWDGLAMVEFRVNRRGHSVLLEVNGRFWGSLALALAAGMDFPLWLYRYLVEGDLPPPRAYRAGVRCRWLVGELERLEDLLRGLPGDPMDAPSRLRATWDFLTGFLATSHYDEFATGDLRPGLVDIWQSTGLRAWHKLCRLGSNPARREPPRRLDSRRDS